MLPTFSLATAPVTLKRVGAAALQVEAVEHIVQLFVSGACERPGARNLADVPEGGPRIWGLRIGRAVCRVNRGFVQSTP
jgi:hypothetical protein